MNDTTDRGPAGLQQLSARLSAKLVGSRGGNAMLNRSRLAKPATAVPFLHAGPECERLNGEDLVANVKCWHYGDDVRPPLNTGRETLDRNRRSNAVLQCGTAGRTCREAGWRPLPSGCGRSVSATQFFFLAACLHYLPNTTKQLRNEMAPKRFRLSAYKPTTWQLGVLPVAFGLIPRSHWLLWAVCQTEGRHRPRPLLISVHGVLPLTLALTGKVHGFGVAISSLRGSTWRSPRQLWVHSHVIMLMFGDFSSPVHWLRAVLMLHGYVTPSLWIITSLAIVNNMDVSELQILLIHFLYTLHGGTL